MLEEDKISVELAKISADIKKIKVYIRWQKTYSFLTVLLIVIPIILGFLYLPPYIRQILDVTKIFPSR